MTDDKDALERTVDSHGGTHYKDEAAAARHIIEGIVNDKDALEELREMRAWWAAHDTCSVPECFQHRQVARLDTAIAAWEKERATWENRNLDLANSIASLRAEVERIATEMERVGEGRPPLWSRADGVPNAIKAWSKALKALGEGDADELNARGYIGAVSTVLNYADALDAALRGGA